MDVGGSATQEAKAEGWGEGLTYTTLTLPSPASGRGIRAPNLQAAPNPLEEGERNRCVEGQAAWTAT